MEGIEFGCFVSSGKYLNLMERQAPSPDEKEVKENIAYRQGDIDFSFIAGERIFNNRKITYRFEAYTFVYDDRKVLENMIKNELMPQGIGNLYDSHDVGFHWKGKCESVSIEDGHKQGVLDITIVFDCYPFLISDRAAGNDEWNSFYFPMDFATLNYYVVNGSRDIVINNFGSSGARSEITVTEKMKLVSSDKTLELLPTDVYTDIHLFIGNNKFTVQGNGTLYINYFVEVMA